MRSKLFALAIPLAALLLCGGLESALQSLLSGADVLAGVITGKGTALAVGLIPLFLSRLVRYFILPGWIVFAALDLIYRSVFELAARRSAHRGSRSTSQGQSD